MMRVGCLVMLLASPVVIAADRTDDAPAATPQEQGAARRLFEQALAALEQGRFAVARDLFSRSLALHPTRATAFNLAVALRGTGQIKRALDVLGELRDGRHGVLDDRRRSEVSSLEGELRSALATLALRVTGANRAEVRLDGVAIGGEDLTSLSVVTDPGPHVVTGNATGMKSVERRVVLESGRKTELTLAFEPARDEPGFLIARVRGEGRITIPGVGSADGRIERRLRPATYVVQVANAHGESHSRVEVLAARTTEIELAAPTTPLVRRPWFWVATAAAVAAVGAAGYLFVTREASPTSDPVFGTVFLLRDGAH